MSIEDREAVRAFPSQNREPGRRGMMHFRHIFHPILGEGRDAGARIGKFLAGRVP